MEQPDRDRTRQAPCPRPGPRPAAAFDSMLAQEVVDLTLELIGAVSWPTVLDDLSSAAMDLKKAYLGRKPWEAVVAEHPGAELWLAYLGLYVPTYPPRVGAALTSAGIPRDWILPSRSSPVRVLDLGAGPGSSAVGLLDHLNLEACTEQAAIRDLELVLADRNDDALKVGVSLIKRLESAGRWPSLRLTLRSVCAAFPGSPLLLGGPFDLVLIGHMLSEYYQFKSGSGDDPLMASLPQTLANLPEYIEPLLSPDGLCLILEAALKEKPHVLLRTRDGIRADGRLEVVAPCPGQGESCPELLRPARKDMASCSGRLMIRLPGGPERHFFEELNHAVYPPWSSHRMHHVNQLLPTYFSYLLLSRRHRDPLPAWTARMVRRVGLVDDAGTRGFGCVVDEMGREVIRPVTGAGAGRYRCYEMTALEGLRANGRSVAEELGGWPTWYSVDAIVPINNAAIRF